MNKKILIIELVCTFLIIGSITASAVIIKPEKKPDEYGQIVCHVRDKDAPPAPEPKGIKNIKLVLKNDDGTLTKEGITDDKGQYIFIDLLYGGYTITAYGSFGYSNETKIVPLKEPEIYVEFELTKKSRSKDYLDCFVIELFKNFHLLKYIINYAIIT